MQPLFSFAEVEQIGYISGDAGIVLTPEQQSLAVQAVALLENPDAWTDYDLYGDEIDALVASLSDALLTTELPPPVVGMDSEIILFPGSMTLLTGGAITNVANPSALHNYTSEITPNANGNSRRAYRYMAAGDWAYRLTAVTLAAGCSMTFSIVDADGTVHFLPAVNLRTAATVFNAVFTGTFTLNQSGLTQVFFGVNAGSTGGFRDLLTVLEMWRTDEP